MARRKKRKPPKYDSAGQARRLARALLGAPPGARVIPPKRHKSQKHKKRERERESED